DGKNHWPLCWYYTHLLSGKVLRLPKYSLWLVTTCYKSKPE
ncbi:MAG: hypothetical protein ACI952_002223, partial [Flavobacteriales bacterium]